VGEPGSPLFWVKKKDTKKTQKEEKPVRQARKKKNRKPGFLKLMESASDYFCLKEGFFCSISKSVIDAIN